MFDRAKRLYELQKQAKTLRKQLQAHAYTAESSSGDIVVTVNGEQEITQLTIGTARYAGNDQKLSAEVLSVLNKAMAKSKKGSAELMRGMMGGLGLGGLA